LSTPIVPLAGRTVTEERLFLAALDLPDAAARADYLDDVCRDDIVLRADVEALLASHFRSGPFLDVPAAEQMRVDPRHGDTVTALQDAVTEKFPAAEADWRPFLSSTTRPDFLGRIGRYEVLQVLGRGGFGVVFRALDETLQRVVAVKVLAPQLAATSPARRRFLREARSSAQVRHENVVRVYEVVEHPLPFLVMEFIPGETVQQRLDRVGPFAVPEILRIGRQIAEGLAAAHAHDLIHRDIKPGNVLLESGPHGHAKITDFGLARAADDASISQSGVIAGTPMYMAPEQAQGRPLDHRADLFSLGSVLYQMVTGRAPFRANTTVAVLRRVSEDTPRAIREIIAESPPWLCDIIAKLHAKDPADRYQSAREVADVLADCEAQLKAHSKLKDFSLIPRRTSGNLRWLVAAAVVLLPALALVVVELAGVTHQLRGRQADPDRPTGDPTGVAVPRQDSPPVPPTNPGGLSPTFINDVGMEFVIVPKGKSWLGGGKDKLGDKGVEFPADFYLGKYEVIQEEWEKVMGENPNHFSRTGGGKDAVKDVSDADLKRFPVDRVSWDQCQLFVAKLNSLEKEAGWIYRLPTELEWEYACRGGSMADQRESAFDYYLARPTNTLLPEQANFGKDTGLNRTCKVGSYEANRLGLFDMHGNVWEWCEDAEKVDRRGSLRINRGGAWIDAAFDCVATRRGIKQSNTLYSHRGCRLARVPVGMPAPQAKAPSPAVAPFDDAQARKHQEDWASYLGRQVEVGPTAEGHTLRLIPPGTFLMGAGADDELAGKNEQPQQEVKLTRPFYLGTCEVMVAQFRRFAEDDKYTTKAELEDRGTWGVAPGIGGKDGFGLKPGLNWKTRPPRTLTDDHPVCCLAWTDAAAYCTWLSKKEGEAYRLPTETEWEYACRAGTTTRYSFGNEMDGQKANLRHVYPTPRPVPFSPPNPFGIHDMHGNVAERCQDAPRSYGLNPATDPVGTGTNCVYRGGQWFSQFDSGNGRSSARHHTPARLPEGITAATDLPVVYVGFRVVVDLSPRFAGGSGKGID
jgi:formylglycine-generating enzyme required for sulfatase activity